MSQEDLLVQRTGHYVTLTLNRAHKLNALSPEMLERLDAELAAIEQDKDVRALLLRAQGRAFCAGADLGQLETDIRGRRLAADMQRRPGPAFIELVLTRLQDLPVPTIAAINGPAITVGLLLALHCDMRIAGSEARMGFRAARVGLLVSWGFMRKVIEIVGAARAAELMYKADIVDARRALEVGLVNEVVEQEQLEQTARAWAEQISSNAPLSVRLLKAILRGCVNVSDDRPTDRIMAMMRTLIASEDTKEGVRAFLEKRDPIWKGR